MQATAKALHNAMRADSRQPNEPFVGRHSGRGTGRKVKTGSMWSAGRSVQVVQVGLLTDQAVVYKTLKNGEIDTYL